MLCAGTRISLRISFFFQAEDGIRDLTVTGVQTCALPIFTGWLASFPSICLKPEPTCAACHWFTIKPRLSRGISSISGPATAISARVKTPSTSIRWTCRSSRTIGCATGFAAGPTWPRPLRTTGLLRRRTCWRNLIPCPTSAFSTSNIANASFAGCSFSPAATSIDMLGSEKFLPARDYHLAATLTSGQAFGWQFHAGAWEGVIGSRWVRLRQAEEGILAATAAPVADWGWLVDYLQTEVDLNGVLLSFPADEPMRASVAACRGLRLLRQDHWECLASFILSSSKQIVQIQQITAQLCARFGAPLAVGPGDAL